MPASRASDSTVTSPDASMHAVAVIALTVTCAPSSSTLSSPPVRHPTPIGVNSPLPASSNGPIANPPATPRSQAPPVVVPVTVTSIASSPSPSSNDSAAWEVTVVVTWPSTRLSATSAASIAGPFSKGSHTAPSFRPPSRVESASGVSAPDRSAKIGP